MSQKPALVQNQDFPTWNHSGQYGPIQYQMVLQPSRTTPGSPWLVHVQLNHPVDWILEKATLGSKSLEFSKRPITRGNDSFEMEYLGDFPPFGSGPQLETLWDTPTGQVTLLLDHGLKLESLAEVPQVLPKGGSFPWAPGLILGFLLILVGCQWWIRQNPAGQLKKWGKRAKASQPLRDASWPIWENWLSEHVQSARKLSVTPTTIVLIALLDNARFGIPYNDSWCELIQKLAC